MGAAMAGRRRPSPQADDPGEEERDRRIPCRRVAAVLGGTPREEEGGAARTARPREEEGPGVLWRHPQGGGGGSRLNRKTQGGGGVLPYLSGGILREEEGGCRLNPDPREEGVGYSVRYFVPQAAS